MKKKCTKCDKELLIKEFHKNLHVKSGLRAECKGCTQKYHQKNYLKNKGKILKQTKKWRKENRDKISVIQKRYYLKGGKEYQAKYRANNKEQIIDTKKRYIEKHKHNPKYWISGKISIWRSKFPCVTSDLTTKYLVDLYEQQGGKCYYTNEEIGWGYGKGKAMPYSASLDRLIPSKGYIQGNVVWCSFRVNTMKGNLSEFEFYNYMQNILFHKQEKHE